MPVTTFQILVDGDQDKPITFFSKADAIGFLSELLGREITLPAFQKWEWYQIGSHVIWETEDINSESPESARLIKSLSLS